ncbi:MAG: Na(+)-translocating NADH-quinone reductase subunit A [Holophagales bacterium]|nr:Na(+)-translocating NADH-quinone reductase subunit A [Holophagales bacterium]MYF97368.1 Na(+)-translocating NADH-quinone reductase subunit A [Holophagales bacterium]
MGTYRFRRGLSLPIAGAPEQTLEDAAAPGTVAVSAADYPGMKPAMHVGPGDAVRRGQLLFEDRKQPGVRFTSPAAGSVAGVNRGAKRALISVVVRVDPSDQAGSSGAGVGFAGYTGRHPSALSREEVQALLVESGDWVALRARPFGRTAAVDSAPKSIFVNAMNTEPFAPHADRIVEGRAGDLERGLAVLTRLTDGPVYLCRAPGTLAGVETSEPVRVEEFAGPHPAGAAGVHIHTLDPVNRNKVVWQIGLQDTLAIGRLFATGEPDVQRIVALAGPPVRRPRLLRTRLGASLADLTHGEIAVSFDGAEGAHGRGAEAVPDGAVRVISGSPLSGRTGIGENAPADLHGYLGRFHDTVSVLEDDHGRHFLGWLTPGFGAFSRARAFASSLLPRRSFAMTTTTYGSPRAIVPIGLYESVFPWDLQPTFLLKSLVAGDIERAEELGCLELLEEDLALCTFVCPGKTEYGPHLRDALELIEKEG